MCVVCPLPVTSFSSAAVSTLVCHGVVTLCYGWALSSLTRFLDQFDRQLVCMQALLVASASKIVALLVVVA